MAKSCGSWFALFTNMKRILLALIPVFAVAACGGSVVGTGGNGGGDQSGDGGGGGNGDGGGRATGCPTTEPTSGACCPNGLACEYGTSNGICESGFIDCENGRWVEPPIVPGPACLPSTGCPASESDVQVGTECGDQDLECNFPTGRCTCSQQQGGPIQVNPDGGLLPREWRCETPSDGCAAQRPRIGSDCSQEGQTCNYGGCEMPDSVEIQCVSGRWASEPYACAG